MVVEFWDFSGDLIVVARKSRYGEDWELETSESVWAAKNWLNVPGICYTGETDTCLTGRHEAPNNILYDERGGEFVFRQPRNELELVQVIDASCVDPFQGYAFDGHHRWTLPLIRQWWNERRKLVNWINQYDGFAEWLRSDFAEQRQLDGLRDFCLHLVEEMEHYLQTFAYFVDNARTASDDDVLPSLK